MLCQKNSWKNVLESYNVYMHGISVILVKEKHCVIEEINRTIFDCLCGSEQALLLCAGETLLSIAEV